MGLPYLYCVYWVGGPLFQRKVIVLTTCLWNTYYVLVSIRVYLINTGICRVSSVQYINLTDTDTSNTINKIPCIFNSRTLRIHFWPHRGIEVIYLLPYPYWVCWVGCPKYPAQLSNNQTRSCPRKDNKKI